MTVTDLPTLNALLNATTAVLLVTGRIQIKRGRQKTHKRIMIAALISSVLFLTSYLVYHGQVGSVPYPRFDWTRPLYFAILIPHSILAAVMVPFIVAALIFALKGKFERHKRLVRWVWPVWIYVSVTGIIVYVMLYRL
jgi:putative membrane protein